MYLTLCLTSFKCGALPEASTGMPRDCYFGTSVVLPHIANGRLQVVSFPRFAEMDPASLVLAQSLSPGVSRTWAARADRKNVPLSTLHHRSLGRPSKQEVAQGRQYLTPDEEKAVVKLLLMKSELGHPVRIKFLPSIAFSVARQRSSVKKPNKPPGQKWSRCFAKRHPEIKARAVKPVD